MDITMIMVNVPSVVAQAVEGIAEEFGITRTDVIVRALSREAYFRRIAHTEPTARLVLEHADGRRERIAFLPADVDPIWLDDQ